MEVLILEKLIDIGGKLILKTKIKYGGWDLLAHFPAFMKKATQNLSNNFYLFHIRDLI